MLLAGLAVLLAVAVAVLTVISPRFGTRSLRRVDVEQPEVVVRLVPDNDNPVGCWWRFRTPSDAPPTTVDIFSFRQQTSDATGPWQHELISESLHLPSGQEGHLQGPESAAEADSWEVTLGWTVHRPDANTQASTTFTIRP